MGRWTPPRAAAPSTRRAGLVAVLAMAPLVALSTALLPVDVTLMVAAAVIVLLIVLWSAEASFYVLIFSMLLSPEFVVGDLGGAGTGARGLTLRFDDYVIVVIGLAWLVRLAVYKEAGLLRRNPLNGPVMAYIGACALATGVGVFADRVTPLTGFLFVGKYFEYVIVYFLVVNYVRDREQVKRLLAAALLTATIISLMAIAQIPSGQRVSAPFEGENGEPNTLGGYLVLMIALALAFLAESRTVSRRLLWGGLTALMIAPLMFTYSRTSWLAFVAMLVTITLLCRRRTVFILLSSVGLILLLVSPPQSIVERARYTISETASRGSMRIGPFIVEPSAAARIQSWLTAAEAAAERPLVGWGVTGHSFQDSQYTRTIIETGLMGLLTFLWLVTTLVQAGRTAQREARGDPFSTALATGFLAGLAGLLMHGIGANTFIIVRIMEPFWLIAGLVVASTLIHRAEAPAAATVPALRRRPPYPPRRTGRGPLAPGTGTATA